MFEEQDGPLAWVPTEGRGSLPFLLVHGESLVAAASWAVGESGAELFDASLSFAQVQQAGRGLLVHDPLCPLTPADFLAEAAGLSATSNSVVVGFRPVTDTVKERHGDTLGGTVDRAGLRAVASPVVIPADVLAVLPDFQAADLPALVADLATRTEIRWLEAPPLARRIHDEAGLRVLEALSRSLAG